MESGIIGQLQSWTLDLSTAIEVAAAIIIGLAALEALLRALWIYAHPSSTPQSKELVRLRLGRWLALGLEIELAADIVRTVVAPTWQEIGQLAAIAAIRTALNFFLERDITHATQSEKSPPA